MSGTAALVISGPWSPPVVSGMSDDAETEQPPAPETAVATESAEDQLSNSRVSYRNWLFPRQRGNYASTNLAILEFHGRADNGISSLAERQKHKEAGSYLEQI